MKLENFKKLKVGDTIRYESSCGIKKGRIVKFDDWYFTAEVDDYVHAPCDKVTPRQVIAKIVKRKKPKLEFVGYGIYCPDNIVKEGLVDCVKIDVSKKRYEEDTHEVFVRKIKNKGDKNGSK